MTRVLQMTGMAQEGQVKIHCLWHAADGRCASCKARRIRLDVLHLKDYEMCRGLEDYSVCEFYKEKPVPK